MDIIHPIKDIKINGLLIISTIDVTMGGVDEEGRILAILHQIIIMELKIVANK